MSEYPSWGRYPGLAQPGQVLKDRYQSLPETCHLPYGLGRSYGDSCQNHQGMVLSSKALNHFIHFDEEGGILECEAGVTLAEIINVFLPRGWFLPATPGTKFVTIAGAIANDVHGKNHVSAGSFGCYVKAFELLRSDGQRLWCSANENAQWFYATIGGLGLTGFITRAQIQLKKVASCRVESESIKYTNLTDFFSLSEQSAEGFEYTAAWIDCLAKGDQLGRGHFIRGNHADDGVLVEENSKKPLSMPIVPPISLVNSISLRAFNTLYYQRQREQKKRSTVNFNPFFYPLDGILHWNRMYGKKGFVQYQCVIPKDTAPYSIKAMLEAISLAGEGSFLVVLKMLGDKKSGGLLSFPQQGATLALDFPLRGRRTFHLLNQLDAIVSEAGGRLYAAKDARMSAALFQQSYPEWQRLEKLRDPLIMSDFWRRVTGASV